MQDYVGQISPKHGMGKNGKPYTMYNLQVGGEWYGGGFDQPACKEGDYISFDVEMKGQYKNIKNISVVQAPAGSPPAATPAASGGALPINKREVSIHFQSCRKDAIQTIALLLQHDLVTTPQKKADKMDAILALIDEVATQNYIKLTDVIEAGGVDVADAIPTPADG